MRFAQFMATPIGRLLRIGIGVILIAVGVLAIPGVIGKFVALIGLAPIIAGAFNVCLIAPIIGVPFRGEDLPGAGHPPVKPATPAGQH